MQKRFRGGAFREKFLQNFLFDNFLVSHLQFQCFVGKRNFLGFVENNLIKRRRQPSKHFGGPEWSLIKKQKKL